MPNIPSAAKHVQLLDWDNQAEERIEEGLFPFTIPSGSTNYAALMWQHDSQSSEFVTGCMALPERIIFTIRQGLAPTPTVQGAAVVW